MRGAFVDALMALAEHDERVWLLTGDLGYTVLERFRDRFPDRFVNAGVAEQNMTGVAAGLALSGNVVFTYSIANFPTIRCLEQVRNDVCYHNLDVKIVAVGGGVVYGPLGYTHHAIEDLAIMRALPNVAVVAPGDPVEVRLAVPAIARQPRARLPAARPRRRDGRSPKRADLRDRAADRAARRRGRRPRQRRRHARETSRRRRSCSRGKVGGSGSSAFTP
jgi:transketolase C-terminal domain/subunit